MLNRAIKKYGRNNFVKEILCCYDNEAMMNLAEKILVVIDPEVSYNICKGGHGGFGYVNNTKQNVYKTHTNVWKNIIQPKGTSRHKQLLSNNQYSLEFSRNVSRSLKKYYSNNEHHWLNKKHSDKTKNKMSFVQKNINRAGNKNPSFGTCWITNGMENKKIKKDDLDKWIELGYHKGRI